MVGGAADLLVEHRKLFPLRDLGHLHPLVGNNQVECQPVFGNVVREHHQQLVQALIERGQMVFLTARRLGG
ncbi:hypothetical protein D3C75_1296010 [compost metagenome]